MYEKLPSLYLKIRPELRRALTKKCKAESKTLRRIVEEALEKELKEYVDKRKRSDWESAC